MEYNPKASYNYVFETIHQRENPLVYDITKPVGAPSSTPVVERETKRESNTVFIFTVVIAAVVLYRLLAVP
jgi:hypothetical protein